MSEEHAADISTNTQPTPPGNAHLRRRALLNARVVNGIAFTIVSICIFNGVTVSILAIWDYADTETLWKALATLAVVGFGTTAFAIANVAFGAQRADD